MIKTPNLELGFPKALTIWTLASCIFLDNFALLQAASLMRAGWCIEQWVQQLLLRVILLLHSFSRLIVVGFSLGLGPIESQVLGSFGSVKYVLHSISWTLKCD